MTPRPLSPKRKFRQLDSRIAAYAKTNGIAFDRVRRRIAQMLVCGALTQAMSAELIPMYFIKGGVAMELRFGLLARLTKDIDIGLVAPPARLLEVLADCLALGYGDFTFRVIESRMLRNDVQRVVLQIAYDGVSWAKLELDLSSAGDEISTETFPALHLEEFGLLAPDIVCISIDEQVAQKIHGGTEPDRKDYVNMRARDIYDVLMIDRRVPLNYEAVRARCETTFASRNKHSWPPSDFVVHQRWKADLVELARANGHTHDDPETMQREFTALLARILGVRTMIGFEYQFLTLNTHRPEPGEQFPTPINTRDIAYEGMQTFAKNGWRIVGTCIDPRYSDDQIIIIMERSLEIQS